MRREICPTVLIRHYVLLFEHVSGRLNTLGRSGTCSCPAQIGSDVANNGRALRRLGDGTAGLVVDDNGRVEPANLRLRTVELFHARLPFTVIDGFGCSARLPQIDAAGAAAVLPAQIIFAYEPAVIMSGLPNDQLQRLYHRIPR